MSQKIANKQVPMQQDGARLAKLKEVYKKAVQEIMKEEQTVMGVLAENEPKDSFYSDSSIQVKQEEVRTLFSEIRHRFSEVLKEKIRQSGIDLKLNNLDKDIKEARIRYRDLTDEGYIDEIFESYVVDRKESQVKELERMLSDITQRNTLLEEEIGALEKEVSRFQNENQASEDAYQRIINGLDKVCEEGIEK